jgi:putative ABC transport system permease protein
VINDKLAEELDVRQGGTVTVYYAEQPIPLTVAAVAPSTFLTGQADVLSTEEAGGVMSLTLLRALIGDDGALTGIAVSMDGDVRNDLDVAQDVADALEPTLTDQGIGLLLFKKVNVDISSSSPTSSPPSSSSWSLLHRRRHPVDRPDLHHAAAERRPEMGMAAGRSGSAVASSSSSSSARAPATPCLAGGVGVALGIVATVHHRGHREQPLRRASSRSRRRSRPQPAGRLLLGVVITFLSVVASSIKISRMNVVAAVRDIPEVSNPKRRIRTLVWAGILLLAGLGLVSSAWRRISSPPTGSA